MGTASVIGIDVGGASLFRPDGLSGRLDKLEKASQHALAEIVRRHPSRRHAFWFVVVALQAPGLALACDGPKVQQVVLFVPAEMNHRIAREKARKAGKPAPTNFRGSLDQAFRSGAR